MIHCCNESIVAESGSTTVSDISVPHSLAQKWTLFEREKLYFCKTCQLLQSPDMTTDIVECIYCPMCLVEVPKSSTQRVCTRNCLQCPECKSALDVMKTSKEASNYTLKCTWCEYTTDQYVSDKALAAQILQQQNTLGTMLSQEPLGSTYGICLSQKTRTPLKPWKLCLWVLPEALIFQRA